MKKVPSSEQIANLITDILSTIIIFLLSAIPFKILWNWLLPGIFKFPKIDYMESLGILFFIYFLFPFGKRN